MTEFNVLKVRSSKAQYLNMWLNIPKHTYKPRSHTKKSISHLDNGKGKNKTTHTTKAPRSCCCVTSVKYVCDFSAVLGCSGHTRRRAGKASCMHTRLGECSWLAGCLSHFKLTCLSQVDREAKGRPKNTPSPFFPVFEKQLLKAGCGSCYLLCCLRLNLRLQRCPVSVPGQQRCIPQISTE